MGIAALVLAVVNFQTCAPIQSVIVQLPMSGRIPYQEIKTRQQLAEFCKRSVSSRFIGFDTEFVSENRYRPELCLLQVATDEEFAIIDTLAIDDISDFWNLLVTGDHVTIAHAAREEFLFCYRACRQRPQKLFDVQLAAGMIGLEYPAAYANLVSKILGTTIDKGETRTDWMKRPLSQRQIDYALRDVIHLKPLYESISASLQRLKRTAWLEEEMQSWQTSLEATCDEPQWQRVSGISGLKSRELAIVRDLWNVRDEEAEKKNRSPKRVLADDLIVELARRGTSDPKRLKAIRGFENRVAASLVGRISSAIATANSLPDSELPPRMPRSKTINLGLLGQFLTTALKIVCMHENISPAIVGTSQDVRDLAAWRMGLAGSKTQPALAKGWRAEIIGQLIEKMLDGSVAIRVDNPKSSQPLILENIDGSPIKHNAK